MATAPKLTDLSVGDMAARSGVAISTLHYYEDLGLIESWRTPANHRRYDRRELRRVAVIRVAQSLGIPLSEIKSMLDRLPTSRAVRKADWQKASERWKDELELRILVLQELRDQLDSCIGCGCLSLEACPLYNEQDKVASRGSGPVLFDERVNPNKT